MMKLTYKSSAGHELLFDVYIEHNFYETGICTDFDIVPTDHSMETMADLGLQFKTEPGAFKILYDKEKLDFINRFIDNEIANSMKQFGKPAWPRLSFEMRSLNPYFVNYSEYIDLNDEHFFDKTLYFSNRNAHPYEDEVLITRGDHVAGDEMFPITPTDFSVAVPDAVNEYTVTICDIADLDVISEKSCQPSDPPIGKFGGANNAVKITRYIDKIYERRRFNLRRHVTGEGDNTICSEKVFFNLNLECIPAGKYTVKIKINDEVIKEEGPFVYSGGGRAPQGFIDILFKKPPTDMPIVSPNRNYYPIRKDGSVQSQTYYLKFKTRKTFWRYYIVTPEKPSYEDIIIRSKRNAGGDIGFVKVDKTPLPFGKGLIVQRFDSIPAIKLMEISPYYFSLQGQIAGGREDANQTLLTIVDRLETASPIQVVFHTINDKEVNGKDQIKAAFSNLFVYV